MGEHATRNDAAEARQPLVQAAALDGGEDEEHAEPRATFLLMLVFLALLGGIWLYVYLLLLGRQ